jgi:Fe-S cluster assembly scaffold protein SufB
LQSRGVDQETARRLLVRAFAGEIIDSATLEPVKAYMEKIFAKQAQDYRLT